MLVYGEAFLVSVMMLLTLTESVSLKYVIYDVTKHFLYSRLIKC